MGKISKRWLWFAVPVFLYSMDAGAWTSRLGFVGGYADLHKMRWITDEFNVINLGLSDGRVAGIQVALRERHFGFSCILNHLEFSSEGTYPFYSEYPSTIYARFKENHLRILSLNLQLELYAVSRGWFQPYVCGSVSFNSFSLSRIYDKGDRVPREPFSDDIRTGTALGAGILIRIFDWLELNPAIRYETFNEIFNVDHDDSQIFSYEDVYENILREKELVAVTFSISMSVVM